MINSHLFRIIPWFTVYYCERTRVISGKDMDKIWHSLLGPFVYKMHTLCPHTLYTKCTLIDRGRSS